mgnify:CR=1 FL=1
MDVEDDVFLTLSDLYKAYSKAKCDAFYDKSHFSALAYAAYEQKLDRNLRRLLRRLEDPQASWACDLEFIGSYGYLPKSVEQPQPPQAERIHFATLDSINDWNAQCAHAGGIVEASFRQVMVPTVEFQIVSALWIIKVGHLFDRLVDRKLSFAHVLRRVGKSGPIAEESRSLFQPYIQGYKTWRSRGLSAMKSALKEGRSIAAVTMDIRRFYHCVSPSFLLNKGFLKRSGVSLSSDQYIFTANFIRAIDSWYAVTPDAKGRPEGALPVGLTASRVISNVLLAEFDKVCAAETGAIYYGRYADDIFLVVDAPKNATTGDLFIRWLRDRLDGWLVLKKEEDGSGLRLTLPYAKDSKIVFSSGKQKIFFLSGDHGTDLVDQIVEKIQDHSSEYRNLPELPDTSSRMAAQALLATPDARLEADALRKAEAVSIRRLGFSLLLGDVEAYARDLDPKEWREIRLNFYGLVLRYVVTPVGFFDYFNYVIKVFSLMVSCGDIRSASEFLNRFESVVATLEKTTTAGKSERRSFELALSQYYRGFTQAAFESATVSGFRFTGDYLALLKRVSRRPRRMRASTARLIAQDLLKSDLGRRPYYDYWFKQNRRERRQPDLPTDFFVRRSLALTRKFRGKVGAGLNAPYWPAIAFCTRPIPIWNLCLSAPNLMFEPGGLERAIWATRGSRVNPRYKNYAFLKPGEDGSHVVTVPYSAEGKRKFGVPSYLTTDAQWVSAFNGVSDRSYKRYVGIRRLINRILEESPDIDYLAFPECSVPLDWAVEIAHKLGQRGVSLLVGIENRGRGLVYKNEALVSLVSNFFGRRGCVCFIQPKLALAHSEAKSCEAAKKTFVAPHPGLARPVYVHGGLCLGLLLCSDFTNISNRSFLQGKIDVLFVLEWNKDTGTFEFLVEAAAHDLHAAIVQVNNRQYGDSRIRLPFSQAFGRDVVRVKGGDADFYVVSTIDFGALRAFQRSPASAVGFKPLPIGFVMSDYRKNSSVF